MRDVPKVKRLKFAISFFKGSFGIDYWAINQMDYWVKGWPPGFHYLAKSIDHAHNIIEDILERHEYALVLFRPEQNGPVTVLRTDEDWVLAKLQHEIQR